MAESGLGETQKIAPYLVPAVAKGLQLAEAVAMREKTGMNASPGYWIRARELYRESGWKDLPGAFDKAFQMTKGEADACYHTWQKDSREKHRQGGRESEQQAECED